MHPQRSVWILVTSLVCVAACTSGEREGPAGPRFVVRGSAVVRDAVTGLEWTRRDDGVGLDWHKAEAYCESLSVDDAGRWRLPSVEELRSLYGATTRVPCGAVTCAIDPAFALTEQYVWTASGRGPQARTYLDFQFGTELTPTISPRLLRRVLCVRAR